MSVTVPLSHFDGKLMIFGCGTMAGAMLHRWLECGLGAQHVTAVRKSGEPVADGVRVLTDTSGEAAPDVLVIGIKPTAFAALAPSIEALAGPDTLVISIMAGMMLEDLRLALPRASGLVRAMPNLPVAQGRGIVATVGDAGAGAVVCDALLQPLGMVHPLGDENGFNLVTALTGCGPAFVYRFVSALAGAAVRLGLPEADADKLARAMVDGAARSVAESADTPAAMAAAVASPGGMTQAGLDVLDSDGRLVALMADTLRAARDRGREMAAAARAG